MLSLSYYPRRVIIPFAFFFYLPCCSVHLGFFLLACFAVNTGFLVVSVTKENKYFLHPLCYFPVFLTKSLNTSTDILTPNDFQSHSQNIFVHCKLAPEGPSSELASRSLVCLIGKTSFAKTQDFENSGYP